jgi:hypothetical protein
MHLDRLNTGEKIEGVSAILLFVLMFFHWFGVEYVNNSDLLFYVAGSGPGKSAWEALDYVPIVLMVTIVASLSVVGLRLASANRMSLAWANAVVAILGAVSGLLIVVRIFSPPNFGIHQLITYEGTVQPPIFVALLAAAGIAFGGYRAMRASSASTGSGDRPLTGMVRGLYPR